MRKEYEIKPIWYRVACDYSNFIPFAGGMISDHLAHTVSPEAYYYEHAKGQICLGPLLFVLNILFDIAYLAEYSKQPLYKGLFLGSTTLGYLYNMYKLNWPSNNFEEIKNVAYEDAVRPWRNLKQIAIDRANDEFEEILQASIARNNQSEGSEQLSFVGENNQSANFEQLA